ncbi:putative hopanoid-associated sugar epimerase [Leptospira inadai serovar Lyme str. 10]|uniref:Epimerase n=2 Tax=Leptospira inadai serovar Lyme TaxID=293084 RepID=A0ABX4YKC5_9LEPT|nr:SDR family oxidoreductase [Leptospira inadai]EQA36645.1 putative hopanoid-associated sugar epimerase [Leptospira inadai serovar Lyme str. 10]PNV75600.1 epimerase [Leptospira inadai serovar Lyme]
MKKLVTGAAGFIGSAIVRELLKEGHEVKVLIRKSTNPKGLEGLDVEVAYGDICDGDSMRSALKGCDTLYQTAAFFAHWTLDKKLPYEVNVEGTKTSMRAALDAGVEKVIYTSTGNTIGAHGEIPANETAEFNHWKSGDHYSISKYLGEVEALKFVSMGLPIVVVNPTLVIGAGDVKPTTSGQMIIDVVQGAMPGYIDGGTNVIDVSDVAKGHLLAAKKGRVGERYLLGNENLTLSEYFGLIAEIAGVKPPRIKIPYYVALGMGYIFELGAAITKKHPIATASEIRIGKSKEFFDCSKAVRELGLPQTSVRIAIQNAIDWFKENGYLKK